MKKESFYRELEIIVGMTVYSISGGERLEEIEGWDSMAVISFIAFADAKLGVNVTADNLIRCETVSDLEALFAVRLN
jgi:acyl carrier protein